MTTSATYIMTNLNCCINFVVYFVMYSAFRRELKEQAIAVQRKLSRSCDSIKRSVTNVIFKSKNQENQEQEQGHEEQVELKTIQ